MIHSFDAPDDIELDIFGASSSLSAGAAGTPKTGGLKLSQGLTAVTGTGRFAPPRDAITGSSGGSMFILIGLGSALAKGGVMAQKSFDSWLGRLGCLIGPTLFMCDVRELADSGFTSRATEASASALTSELVSLLGIETTGSPEENDMGFRVCLPKVGGAVAYAAKALPLLPVLKKCG